MKQYVFPAIFLKESDDSYTAFIPDLNLTSEGSSIEETFLFIQDFLSIYCSYVSKSDEEETLIPSKFEKIQRAYPSAITMLVDAFVN